MRRGSFRLRPTTKKRMDWTGAQLRASIGFNSVDSAYVLEPTIIRDLFTSPTLMASIFQINVRLAETSAIGGFAGFGLIRWDDIDDTPPTFLDAPGPLANIDLDWIYRFVAPIPQGTPGGTIYSPGSDVLQHSRARRKLENTSGLLACFETIDVSAFFAVDARVLIKQV